MAVCWAIRTSEEEGQWLFKDTGAGMRPELAGLAVHDKCMVLVRRSLLLYTQSPAGSQGYTILKIDCIKNNIRDKETNQTSTEL